MPIKIENERGSIIIQNDVLAKIAGMAATRCYGVVGMTTRKGANALADLLLGESITKGVKISIEDDTLIIDLYIMVEYGVNIKAISDNIVNNVKYSVESISGFKVGKVNINIVGARVD